MYDVRTGHGLSESRFQREREKERDRGLGNKKTQRDALPALPFRLDAQVCRAPKEQPKDPKKCEGAAQERKQELVQRMSFMEQLPLPVNPLKAAPWDYLGLLGTRSMNSFMNSFMNSLKFHQVPNSKKFRAQIPTSSSSLSYSL